MTVTPDLLSVLPQTEFSWTFVPFLQLLSFAWGLTTALKVVGSWHGDHVSVPPEAPLLSPVLT